MRRYKILLFVLAATALLLAGWYFHSASNDDPRTSSVATETAERDADSATPDPATVPAEPGKQIENGISGHVYMAGSVEPVAEVTVEARPSDPAYATLNGKTDETGAYSIVGAVPRQEYMIVADARERNLVATERPFVQLNEGEVRTGVDLFLWEGATIRGKVTARTVENRTTRITEGMTRNDESLLVRQIDEPLPGITVRARADMEIREEPLTAVTGSDGRYEFRHVPAASVRVRAEPPDGVVRYDRGHESQVRKVDTSKQSVHEDVDFYFRFDDISVTGRVTDVDGQPIAGAEVVAARPKFDAWRVQPDGSLQATEKPGRRPELSARAVTDNEGFYSLDGFIPATGLSAMHYRLQGSLPQETTYTFNVSAFGFARREVWLPMIGIGARSASDAILDELKRMYADELPRGQPFPPFDRPLPEIEDGRLRLDFVLEHEAVVYGRVVDRRGEPQPGCRVRAERERLAIGGRSVPPPEVETDRLGRFVLSGLPAGEHILKIVTVDKIYQSPRNGPLPVKAGEVIRDYDVIIDTVEDLGGIAGRVLNSQTREPIPEFHIEIKGREASDGGQALFGKVEQPSEPDGSFEVTALSPGRVELRFSAAGYSRADVASSVERGAAQRIDVLLDPEGVLEGRITRNGVGARGVVELARIPSLPESGFRVHTDENGDYRIDKLPGAEFIARGSVEVNDLDTNRSTRYEITRITMQPGEYRNMDFDIGGTASIYGALPHAPDVNPIVYVRAADAPDPVPIDDELSLWQQVVAITHAGNAQSYEVRGLRPGAYKVTAVFRIWERVDGRRVEVDRRELPRTVSLSEGQTLELNFEE